MKTAMRNGFGESSEMDARNIYELTRDSDRFRELEIMGDEIATNSLGPLLQRVSAASCREFDLLIRELQTLSKRLGTDGNRIQRDIEEYAKLNQHVMQLTAVIADSVNSFSTTSGESYAS